MAADSGMTDQLDALLAGKRRSRRLQLRFRIHVKGVAREFRGISCDISEGGVLLELSHAELTGEADAVLGPAQQLALVETHFRDNFDVHFPDHDAVAEATLVRLSVRPEEPLTVYLGCQFVHPLGEAMRRRLGLIPDATAFAVWEEVEPLQDLRRQARPRNRLFALVFDDVEGIGGPRYMGPVVAVGAQALVVRVEVEDCDAVTDALGGQALRVRVMRGNRALWTATAELLATRYRDGPRQGSEIGLLTQPPPGRKIRKHFKRV